MTNSLFRFKQFSVIQQNNVFKIGTDGVAAALLANCLSAHSLLEIGCGTGVMSLVAAQRNNHVAIQAIDIDKNATQLATTNFQQSPFKRRLQAFCCDANTYSVAQKYDYIMSNPPFFDSKSTAHTQHAMARQQLTLSYHSLLACISRNLHKQGISGIIFPFPYEKTVENIAETNRLFVVRKIIIYGMVDSVPRRIFAEFGFEKKSYTPEIFVLEQSPRVYTEAYKTLAKDFYLKF